MPKYQITLTFETEEDVPQEFIEELEATAFVQLETLEDGDLEGQKKGIAIIRSFSESKKLDWPKGAW